MNKRKLSVALPIWAWVIIVSIALSSTYLIKNIFVNNNQKPGINSIATNNGWGAPNTVDKNNPEYKKMMEETKIDRSEVDQKVSFKVKFVPANKETIAGTLKSIHVAGKDSNNGKATDITLYYTSGIQVDQLIPDPVEAKSLDSYIETVKARPEGKDTDKIIINGVNALATPAKIQDNTFGAADKSPGSVFWYKDGILHIVYGNGEMPLNKLIEVAESLE